MIGLSILLAVSLLLAIAYHRQPPPLRVAALAPQRPPGRTTSSRTRLIVVVVIGGCLVVISETVLVLALTVAFVVRAQAQQVLRKRRAVARMICAFPDFVDLLVLTVRAGHTPLQAFEALQSRVDPSICSALSATVARVRRGERFADALGGFAELTGDLGTPVASALALADRYGTPLPPVLDRLATDARAARRRQAEASARRLPILLSFPLVICTLPSFALLTIVPLLAGTLSSLRELAF